MVHSGGHRTIVSVAAALLLILNSCRGATQSSVETVDNANALGDAAVAELDARGDGTPAELSGPDGEKWNLGHFAFKETIINGLDGVSGFKQPGVMALSSEGDMLLVGSSWWIWNYDGEVSATVTLFRRDGTTGSFVQADSFQVAPTSCGNGGVCTWDVSAIATVPGKNRAFLILSLPKGFHGPYSSGLLSLLLSVDWDPLTGAVVSVVEHPVEVDDCSTADGCLYLERDLTVSSDGQALYVTALRSAPLGSDYPFEGMPLLTLSIQGEQVKVLGLNEMYTFPCVMQWSREDAILLWLTDVDWVSGWKKDAGELTLSKLFELKPECTADGCVGTDLPLPDCSFRGRTVTAGMEANEYYVADDLTISEDEYARVHTLVACDDETCPAGTSSVAAYRSYIAQLGEQTGCDRCVPPHPMACYDADRSWGLAAGAGGRRVALLSGLGHPEKIIILHRDETSYELVPFQELPLEIGDLPGYEAKLECVVGFQAPGMLLSPDGGDLFVVGETWDIIEGEGSGVLLHFRAGKE